MTQDDNTVSLPDAGDPGPAATAERAAPAVRRPAITKLAAIDIGSNSVHMLMVELRPDHDFRVLGRDKEMVRLGRGGYRNHVLTPEASDAGVTALGRFVKLARARGIDTFRAVATSAVREAANGGDFIERVRRELGLKVKVVSGREEGRLVWLAVRHGVDFGDDVVLGLDLGGGSLEITAGTRSHLLKVESYKAGSGRMAELHLRHDPPTDAELAALRANVREALDPDVAAFRRTGFQRCIGTSGTLLALADMCGAERAGRREEARRAGAADTAGESAHIPVGSLPGFTRAELSDLFRRLSRRPADQRSRIPGADPKRADQIVAGAAVVLEAMEVLGIESVSVSDQGLRDGIVLHYLDRHQGGLRARTDHPDPRRRTVLYLAERCGWHQDHAGQVARLAGLLFDGFRPLHGLPASSRELLTHAATLHDIGYLIGQDQHHRHSEYLIRNGGLMGFAPDEIEIIALTARFHRGSPPKKRTCPEYAALPKPRRRVVKVLSALLRLAEGLDRTHFSAVTDVRVRPEAGRVVLEVHGGDVELEVWAASRRSDLFADALGLPLEVVHVRDEEE